MAKYSTVKSFIISFALHLSVLGFLLFLHPLETDKKKVSTIHVSSFKTESDEAVEQIKPKNKQTSVPETKQKLKRDQQTPNQAYSNQQQKDTTTKQEYVTTNAENKQYEQITVTPKQEKQKNKDEVKEYIEVNMAKIREAILKYKRYPLSAIKTGGEGVCSVSFRLNPTGNIEDIKIAKSSGLSVLDKSSIQTIEDAACEMPKPHNSITLTIPIEYKLN